MDKLVIRKKYFEPFFLACFLLVFLRGAANAEENGTLTGLVMDVAQQPVAGVEVYVYDTTNIRRPADYISAPTDNNGEFRVTLPPGRYWTVARFRQGGQKFGPLLPGDKHSGLPLEVDIMPGEELDEEYIVADLEETSQLTVKFDTTYIKVEGIIVTKDGKPVENGYVFANRQPAAKKIPDFVGPWTDKKGRFTLYLPEGTFYFAPASTFPPGLDVVPEQKVSIDSNTKNINIVSEK